MMKYMVLRMFGPNALRIHDEVSMELRGRRNIDKN